MTLNDRTRLWLPMCAFVMATSNAGCQDRPELTRSVQNAVQTGTQGALATRLEARPGPAPAAAQPSIAPSPAEDPSATVPQAHLEGVGADARLVIAADAHHVAPSTARVGNQFAATWTDHDSQTIRFAAYDASAHAVGASHTVHRSVECEESASAASIVASGDGYAVAWIDSENGRVRFARLDASGTQSGPATIVHEGLEAPQSARLLANGREFAVAVALWHGVYFARINAQGERAGEGSVLAEDQSVRSIDELRVDGANYGLGWTEDHNGQPVRVHQRVSGAGRVQAQVVGSRRSTRRVM